jgi:hypothetical protein
MDVGDGGQLERTFDANTRPPKMHSSDLIQT